MGSGSFSSAVPKVTIQRAPKKSSLSTLLVKPLEEVRPALPVGIPPFREGKHRVRLYAGHSSGRKPGPTFAARGPKGREKKCAFTPCWDYDAVDKENGRLTEGGRKSPRLAL